MSQKKFIRKLAVWLYENILRSSLVLLQIKYLNLTVKCRVYFVLCSIEDDLQQHKIR